MSRSRESNSLATVTRSATRARSVERGRRPSPLLAKFRISVLQTRGGHDEAGGDLGNVDPSPFSSVHFFPLDSPNALQAPTDATCLPFPRCRRGRGILLAWSGGSSGDGGGGNVSLPTEPHKISVTSLLELSHGELHYRPFLSDRVRADRVSPLFNGVELPDLS